MQLEAQKSRQSSEGRDAGDSEKFFQGLSARQAVQLAAIFEALGGRIVKPEQKGAA